ncbi:MAG TPA: hypothetical protein VFJ60_08455 [Gaiella sp.]|nr:hypothetical protein [Gaiella sp.]
MTQPDPIELEALSGRVLRIIGAYRIGTALDPRAAEPKQAPEQPFPEPVLVLDEGTAGEVAAIPSGHR